MFKNEYSTSDAFEDVKKIAKKLGWIVFVPAMHKDGTFEGIILGTEAFIERAHKYKAPYLSNKSKKKKPKK